MGSEQMLFGSAFSVHLPPNAKDMSDLRQIPDNQEVFSHAETDQSLMIDILEMVERPDEEAISVHFEDLASSNGVAEGDSQILLKEQIYLDRIALEQCHSCWYVLAEQKIAKFNEAAKNTVQIHMGLLRLEDFSTDLLITLNDPINIHPESSSHKAVPVSATRWSVEDFKQVLCSLKLLDPSIFGCE